MPSLNMSLKAIFISTDIYVALDYIRVYPINRDYSGPSERVRLVTCWLTCDYPTKEFHHKSLLALVQKLATRLGLSYFYTFTFIFSLSCFHFHTFILSLSYFHFKTLTFIHSLPYFYFHTFTFILTLSYFHFHFHNFTFILPLSYFHTFTFILS